MPNKIFLEWRNRYSVGNDALDADHKSIIDLINELYSAIHENSGERIIKSIFDRLLDYTKYHFNREEVYFDKMDYPQAEKHKAIHRSMVRQTQELHEKYLRNDIDIAMEALQFLKDWWIDHIVVKDLNYKSFADNIRESVESVKER